MEERFEGNFSCNGRVVIDIFDRLMEFWGVKWLLEEGSNEFIRVYKKFFIVFVVFLLFVN